MELETRDELLARAVGWEIVTYLKQENRLEKLAQEMEGDALRVLEQIRRALDDEALDDRECFQKIDRIVELFYASGIRTARHDWG